jgi:transcriptional regulator with XRE-family HTH domain
MRLRDLRRAAGLDQTALAERLGISQSRVSKIERGVHAPTAESLTRVADALDLSEDTRAELLDDLAQLWTEVATYRVLARQGHRANQDRYGAMEAAAQAIRVYQPALVPGLLQTADYMRHMVGHLVAPGSSTAGRIEELVAGRLRRQQILYDHAKRLEFVTTEWALRTSIGPPPVLRGQLDRLAMLSELDHVQIGVIPIGAKDPAIALTGFNVWDDVVVVEYDLGEVTLRDPSEVARYVEMFETLRRSALRGAEMVTLVREIEHDLSSGSPDRATG